MNRLIGLVAFAFLSCSNNTPTSTIENTDTTNISNTTNTLPTDNSNTITNTQESGSNNNTVKTENGLTWYTNVEQAIQVSIKEKKPLFLFFTGSDWCGWCIRLQKEVFTKSEFEKWAKSNVVLVELDFPRKKQLPDAIVQQNNQLQQQLGVQGYPTVWMIKSEQGAEKVQLSPLGSLGYEAGGPSAWLKSANAILNNK